MSRLKLMCPCLFGVESLVADELRRLGFADAAAQNGRVLFTGDEEAVAAANLNLRCAERVMIVLGEFRAVTFDELFEGVRRLPWEAFVGRDDAFPVKGWSLNSQLHSVPDCQAIIKKAAVEHLKTVYHVEWFKETGARLQVQFSILKDEVTVCLDTSGEGLHKRGYRPHGNEAPLKETLAAAMVSLSRPYADKPFFDPMCGSGTLLIEAAMRLRHMAPGLQRRFAAEEWGCLPREIWVRARQQAVAAAIRVPLEIQGYDIDPAAVELTRENARRAGVGGDIRVERQALCDFAPAGERGIIVCNPPYGERMLEVQQAEELYRQMGRVFLPLKGFHYYIISPSENFETLFGRRADKRRKLYNGMIKCELFEYFRNPAAGGKFRAKEAKTGNTHNIK